jgi:hypothetical protein
MISADDTETMWKSNSADGRHIGTADHLEGSESIKLTRSDFPDGEHHHLIPLDWVEHVRRIPSSFNERIRRPLPVDPSAELNNKARWLF